MAFEMPALPYALDALEPAIDAKTMEIHSQKHWAGYTSKLNDAIAGTAHADASIEDILASGDLSPAVRNNGGGYYNHKLFFSTLKAPSEGNAPTGDLAAAIEADLGGFDAFKEKFANAAATRFGSGWAWLGVKGGKLNVCSSPNQDNPLMKVDTVDQGCTPILGLDVWEHAYYLHYQNRRPDYIEAFFSVIDWDKVAENYAAAK
ncbi:MAG: superoxide dismutase [Planctomycetota bacterium]